SGAGTCPHVLSRAAHALDPGGQSAAFARRVGGRRGSVCAADAAAALRRDARRGRRRHRLRGQLDAQGRAARRARAPDQGEGGGGGWRGGRGGGGVGGGGGGGMGGKGQAIRRGFPAVPVLTVSGPGGATMPETDFDTLAARRPGDRLLFERSIGPDDIAAYVH